MDVPASIPLKRRRLLINGVVQGVGFRPFVYRLAQVHHLTGLVYNSTKGVCVEVEGQNARLDAFQHGLLTETPPLAHIMDCQVEPMPPCGDPAFVIANTHRDALAATLISPDVAVCNDCLRECFDPTDRRYRYPFINCTNCGPRYTIVENIPYDRPYTSMRRFAMCPNCAQEYHDPANRRFHAQPNACPVCGPQVSLHDRNGHRIDCNDPIEAAVVRLRSGEVLALRGLGGFHLVVDARNEEAVQQLRLRKHRAEKPFALMAPDLERICWFCHCSSEEQAALQQPASPIVLLRAQTRHGLAPSIAPGNRYLGFMLPYTPLHRLLLRHHFDALVMTSGNLSEEPIAMGNEEALERLAPLADSFLLHDREILQRCDDSITRVMGGIPRMIRRSRGYVPLPVFLKHPTRHRILACGGELKNTVALSRENTVFLSQHIGNLDNPTALDFFEDSLYHLQQILDLHPEAIAYDLHPEYRSTRWALQQTKVPRIGVQHHHAHLASVMAENSVTEPCIGLILDGTGYGLDGTIWGGEVLVGDALSFERHAWLQPLPLPGSDLAVRQPWRMAMAALFSTYGPEALRLDLPLLSSQPPADLKRLFQMIEQGINTPMTSSCGRLFDAVAALLGLRTEVTFEAQAAIELEMAVDETVTTPYPLDIGAGRGPLPVTPLLRAIVKDLHRGEATGTIAARFHRTLAALFAQAAEEARQKYGLNRVGLSGGVFQNAVLFTDLLGRLTASGFDVLTHRTVPANDGGLALGQIAVADARLNAQQT